MTDLPATVIAAPRSSGTVGPECLHQAGRVIRSTVHYTVDEQCRRSLHLSRGDCALDVAPNASEHLDVDAIAVNTNGVFVNSPQNRMTNGAVLGVFAQARARTQKMIESVLLGQATSQAALDAAVADMNDQIDKYNKANK